MNLPSITEVDWTGNILTLAYLNHEGKRGMCQFTGDVSANYTWDPSDAGFTRSLLRVFIQEGQDEHIKLIGFRVDHTPTGYAALRALGWDARLPELNPTLTKGKA